MSSPAPWRCPAPPWPCARVCATPHRQRPCPPHRGPFGPPPPPARRRRPGRAELRPPPHRPTQSPSRSRQSPSRPLPPSHFTFFPMSNGAVVLPGDAVPIPAGDGEVLLGPGLHLSSSAAEQLRVAATKSGTLHVREGTNGEASPPPPSPAPPPPHRSVRRADRHARRSRCGWNRTRGAPCPFWGSVWWGWSPPRRARGTTWTSVPPLHGLSSRSCRCVRCRHCAAGDAPDAVLRGGDTAESARCAKAKAAARGAGGAQASGRCRSGRWCMR